MQNSTLHPTGNPTTSISNNNDDDDLNVHSNISNIERPIIIFLVLGIICGICTHYLLLKLSNPVPYHVVVFIEGVILAIVATQLFSTGYIFETVISEPTISSDIILYVLLPSILFRETMNLNWYHFTSGVSHSLLLAGPGAIFGGLITGIFCYFILIYNWSWQVCFLFGAILSTTDPISIIAMLQRSEASNKLTTVIVGESLFNDGAAMLLYLYFYNEQTYQQNPTLLIELIFKIIIASPLLGITIGLLGHQLMRLCDSPIHPNIDIQIMITIGLAYLSFYIAEGPCNMSGVLCCCGAGLMIAWLGSPKILDEKKMNYIWENLEWFCNTIIFFVAGSITGSNTLFNKSESLGNDFGMLFVMYIIVNIIRYVMVFLFYPILTKQGFKLSTNELLFTGFSGLRGSLGISLSLVVQSNFDHATNFFFLYAGITSLMLLINATLARYLIRYLKLVEDQNSPKPPEMLIILKQIKRNIRKRIQIELDHIKNELGDYKPQEVNRLCRIMRGSQDIGDLINTSNTKDSKSLLHRISVDSDLGVERNILTDFVGNKKVSKDLLSYIRKTFLDIVRARYWDSIRTGKLGTHAYSAKLLLHSLDVAMDYINDSKIGFVDWNCIEEGLEVNWFYHKLCIAGDDMFELFGFYLGFSSHAQAKRERMAIYTLLNYIDAHSFAQNKIHDLLGGIDQVDDAANVEELIIRRNSMDLVDKAKEALKRIPVDDVQAFYTSRAAKIVILKQLEVVEQMIRLGTLSKKSAEWIYNAIEDDDENVNLERDTIHRSFLKSASDRKREQDMEMRKSARLSNIGILSSDISGRNSMNRASLYKPRKTEMFNRDNLSVLSDISHIDNDKNNDSNDNHPSTTTSDEENENTFTCINPIILENVDLSSQS